MADVPYEALRALANQPPVNEYDPALDIPLNPWQRPGAMTGAAPNLTAPPAPAAIPPDANYNALLRQPAVNAPPSAGVAYQAAPPAPEAAPADGGPAIPADQDKRMDDFLALARSQAGAGAGVDPRIRARLEALRGGDAAIAERMATRSEATGAAQKATHDELAANAVEAANRLDREQADMAERQTAQQARYRAMEDAYKTAQSDRDKAVDALDPHRIVSGAGRSILFALAAGLGAAASSLRGGGPNHALQIIENAMDRDFAAQRAGVAAKEHRLSEIGEMFQRLRQVGADEETARAGASAAGLARIAKLADSKAQQLAGTEKQAAMQQEADTIRMAASQREQQFLAAAQAAAAKGVSEGEIFKRAQELYKNQEAINAGYLKNRGEGSDEAKSADKLRQSKLADRIGQVQVARQGLEQVRNWIAAGKLGGYSLGNPDSLAPGVDNKLANDAVKLIEEARNKKSASYGGPQTPSDREYAAKFYNIIPNGITDFNSLRSSVLLNRLDALIAQTHRDEAAIVRGQPRQDVAAVTRDQDQKPPSGSVPGRKVTLDQVRARYRQ